MTCFSKKFFNIFKFFFAAQKFEKTFAAFRNVAVGSFEIARVPRVGNVAGAFRKIQQAEKFMREIAAEKGEHIRKIAPFHADEIIVFGIIAPHDLPRPLACAGDVAHGKLRGGAAVHGISRFFGRSARGRDQARIA